MKTKKRSKVYKRRDMKAEALKKKRPQPGTYKRRDMQAEES